MSLEQARAVYFVLMARPGQLAGMEALSNVVSRSTKKNSVMVDFQIGPSGLKCDQNLGSGIVNEGKVSQQTMRRIERRQQMLGVRR